MDPMFAGEEDELILEKEQLRLPGFGENMRDDEEVEEHSEGVESRLSFCIRKGKRCGNGAVFRFAGASLL